MAENLFLRFGQDSASIEWMLLDETSGIVRLRGEGNLEQLSQLVPDLKVSGEVRLLLRGEDVLLTETRIPSKQQRQILQAVPFMVEEQLAADIETCHFAIGQRTSDGNLNVAVVAVDKLQHCFEVLTTLGLKPRHCTVDALLVPYQGKPVVLIDGERALLRTGLTAGICIDKHMLALVVGLLPHEAKATIQILVSPESKGDMTLSINQIQAEQEIAIQLQDLAYPGFETLCRHYYPTAFNLLQGRFKVAANDTRQTNSWRSVAILAVVAFSLHVAVLLAEGIYLDLLAKQLAVQAISLYREISPNDRNIRDMRRRWQGHLRRNADQSADFISLFYKVARNIPGSNLQLDNVNFNRLRGDLVVQLQSPAREQLFEFSKTLQQSGLEAEISGINQTEQAVHGSFKIRLTDSR